MAGARFSISEVKRAVRTLEAVGKCVVRVDFPPEGGFRVLTSGMANDATSEREAPNPLARIFGQ